MKKKNCLDASICCSKTCIHSDAFIYAQVTQTVRINAPPNHHFNPDDAVSLISKRL